ncbi:LacI family DNA-binding transcriptional regulator [Cohnella nanjingensis]|uniref:LacI family DNA-binding transcriptional regulator n=1 Tax=Cohnella nanjingensis TaxID=1387779 RepID=A0A7X0RLY7_9BACL|nr:LacI family DNA-binding transcriptional regulator [Cohnella nanjingensis]MBB6669786.1 LacI family DNA-binding transcriptional regulator [Cohnella nanjingensis]
MASTINDVAKLAEVSRQTVSRVINEPSLVNPKTLEKVQRAIEILDYHPNVTARLLVNKRVKTMGLFMPFSADQVRQNLFFATLSSTICQICSQSDFVMQMFTSLSREDSSRFFVKLFKEKQVGGLILTCPSVSNDELIFLLSEKIPFIIIGRPGIMSQQINYVDVNNVQAGDLAIEHLIQYGHRRIGFLNGPANMTLSADLNKGVITAAQRHGAKLDIRESETDLTLDSGYHQALILLKSDQRPTAIFTADDLLAVGVKKAADELGLSIPSDLSLISGTNSGWGNIFPQELTYIDTQFERLGDIAAKHMIRFILEEQPSNLSEVLPVRLVLGQTCASAHE